MPADPAHPASGCVPSPMSSTISTPTGRPESSTGPRSEYADRPPGARTVETAAVLQPGPAGELRRHHPCPEVGPGQAAVRRTRRGDPGRRGLPGTGRPDRRARGDATAPQVQEESARWYEEIHERQRKAYSSRRIRVEHGIGHLKNWRALARHHGRREHMSDIVQAVAGLLSHISPENGAIQDGSDAVITPATARSFQLSGLPAGSCPQHGNQATGPHAPFRMTS